MTFLVMVEQIMSEDLEPPGDSDGAAAAEASPEAKKLKLESAQPKLVDRKWLNTSAKKDQQDSLANRNGSFKIMQFNTLADALAHTTFIKCPPAALEWKYRSDLLLREILRSEADIVCLEEVDHFQDFFQPELKKRGFEGFFFPKVDSPCLSFPDNNGPDGCVLFYRSAKFELLEKKGVILKNIEGGESHQVAILAKLQIRGGAKDPLGSIVVAMAHLKAKTEGRELRAAQGKHLIEEAIGLSGKGQAMVILGDFNAPPEEEVYEYFSNHEEHPLLKLASSYKDAPGRGGDEPPGRGGDEPPGGGGNEPPFTSWKFRAKGEAKYTIDYVWYTPGQLRLEGVWGIPQEVDIGEGGLPCAAYPSDHVALCSHFTIIN